MVYSRDVVLDLGFHFRSHRGAVRNDLSLDYSVFPSTVPGCLQFARLDCCAIQKITHQSRAEMMQRLPAANRSVERPTTVFHQDPGRSAGEDTEDISKRIFPVCGWPGARHGGGKSQVVVAILCRHATRARELHLAGSLFRSYHPADVFHLHASK
jgi:hypothetical protein